MITIDCPFCDAEAKADEVMSSVTCDACGVTVDVAPDTAVVLDAAA